MLSQLTEQVKKSSQPVSDLLAANAKALQEVSHTQTSLISGVLGDSMKLLQSLNEQTEVKGLLAAQSVYAETVRERITASSKTTYGVFTSMSQQFANVMKTSFDTAPLTVPTEKTAPLVTAAVTKTSVKKASVKKPAVKKTVAKSKTEVVAKAAPAELVETKTVEQPAAPKKVSKPVSKKQAPVTKAAQPLPSVSADNESATASEASVKKPD
jgi:phasin family protein